MGNSHESGKIILIENKGLVGSFREALHCSGFGDLSFGLSPSYDKKWCGGKFGHLSIPDYYYNNLSRVWVTKFENAERYFVVAYEFKSNFNPPIKYFAKHISHGAGKIHMSRGFTHYLLNCRTKFFEESSNEKLDYFNLYENSRIVYDRLSSHFISIEISNEVIASDMAKKMDEKFIPIFHKIDSDIIKEMLFFNDLEKIGANKIFLYSEDNIHELIGYERIKENGERRMIYNIGFVRSLNEITRFELIEFPWVKTFTASSNIDSYEKYLKYANKLPGGVFNIDLQSSNMADVVSSIWEESQIKGCRQKFTKSKNLFQEQDRDIVEMNRILDKVAKYGQSSLSTNELSFLDSINL